MVESLEDGLHLLEERLQLLENIFEAAKLVTPTSDICPLKKPIDDYKWFIDCNLYPNGQWKK